MDKLLMLATDVSTLWGKYSSMYFSGIKNTLLLAIIGTVIGCLIGFVCGILQTIPYTKNDHIVKRFIIKLVRVIVRIYVEVFRGTPMMVQAMVIYWGYAFLNDGLTLDPTPAGIFIVSINTGAYMAEIVRGGILSVDKGQMEGAYSVGMTHFQAMIHVIIPQVLRNILPSVSNEFVINIKDTSVLNVIGVTELYYYAGAAYHMNFKIFETYTIVCVLYFILTFTVTRLLRLVEKKLNGSENYTICGSQSDPEAEIKVHMEAENGTNY